MGIARPPGALVEGAANVRGTAGGAHGPGARTPTGTLEVAAPVPRTTKTVVATSQHVTKRDLNPTI